MTVEELYKNIGGDYQDISMRLINTEKIPKYITCFAQDDSWDKFMAAYNAGADDNILFGYMHTYKGTCLNLSFDYLAEVAIPITDHYRENNRIVHKNVDELIRELSRRHASVLEQIAIFASQK